MMVLTYRSKIQIDVSQIIHRRTPAAHNQLVFERDQGTYRGELEPTPLSMLVALAINDDLIPADQFPRTRKRLVSTEEHDPRPPHPRMDEDYSSSSSSHGDKDDNRDGPSHDDNQRSSSEHQEVEMTFSLDDHNEAPHGRHFASSPILTPSRPTQRSFSLLRDQDSGYSYPETPSQSISSDTVPMRFNIQVKPTYPHPSILHFYEGVWATEGLPATATRSVGIGGCGRASHQGRLWTVYPGTFNHDLGTTSSLPAHFVSIVSTEKTSSNALSEHMDISPSPVESFLTDEALGPYLGLGSRSKGIRGAWLYSDSLLSINTSDNFSYTSTISSDSSVESPLASPVNASSPSRGELGVVFKICRPRVFRDLSPEQMDHGEYNPRRARQAILNEARLYTKELANLQGKAIPRFYGLYHSPEDDVWIMVLERVGPAILDHELLSELFTQHN